MLISLDMLLRLVQTAGFFGIRELAGQQRAVLLAQMRIAILSGLDQNAEPQALWGGTGLGMVALQESAPL